MAEFIPECHSGCQMFIFLCKLGLKEPFYYCIMLFILFIKNDKHTYFNRYKQVDMKSEMESYAKLISNYQHLIDTMCAYVHVFL